MRRRLTRNLVRNSRFLVTCTSGMIETFESLPASSNSRRIALCNLRRNGVEHPFDRPSLQGDQLYKSPTLAQNGRSVARSVVLLGLNYV